MKQILVFLSLLTSIPVLAQDNIQLSGQILNPTSGYVHVSRFSGILLQGVKNDSVKLDAQGRFSFTLPWPKAQAATFGTNKDYTKLFLTPGDKLVLSVDAARFDETLKYTGQGSTINSYLVKSTIEEKKKYASVVNIQLMPEKNFVRHVDSIRTARLTRLQQHFGANPGKAERTFMAEEKNDITYEWADKRIMHYMWRKPADKSKPLPALSEGYFHFLKEVPLAPATYTSPFMLFSLHYSDYLAQEAVKKQPSLKEKDENLLRYEQIEQHFSGQPKRAVLAWLMQEVVMLELDKAPLQAAYQRYISDPKLEPEIRDFVVADWTTANRYKRL